MGASLTYLNEPNTDVETECGDWGPLSYSVSGMQGWRRSMEDGHVAHWDKDKRVGIFGVFDGHGGRGAARFVAQKVIQAMVNSKAYQNNDYPRALHDAFMEVDREMATPEGAKEVMELHEDGLKEDEQKILLHPSQLPRVLQHILGIQGVDDDDEDESDQSDVDDSSYQKEDGEDGEGTDDTTTEDSVPLPEEGGEDIPMADAHQEDADTTGGHCGDTKAVSPAEDGISTAPHTAASSPAASPMESPTCPDAVSKDEAEVEDEIDLDKVEADEDAPEDSKRTGVLFLPNNIGDMVKVNDDGLLEIPESEFWKMLGRQITADSQGCTAVVCCLILGDGTTPAQLICANTGDSRCILARAAKAYALSEDHKPSQDTELERILAAGGEVEECMGQYRVQGDLNLSRALGDHRYKQNTEIPPECQIISAMPDLRVRQLSNEDTHIILGCDGIWEIHSNQQAVDYVLAHEKAALRLIHQTPHTVGQWRSKAKKRKGSPVKTGQKAPEVLPFKQPRLNDVTLHSGAEGSETAFSLAALSGAACQATVCPELRFEDPNFEGSGCDNLTFMIIKIPEEIRKALPAPNPEETAAAGFSNCLRSIAEEARSQR
ncbi:Protein phosphatase 1G [Perkinsus olseni]|uniref:Protein phosphatase 1G n=2 Tax=Perkinsus olseni TaxID=32597 RepID=A0A7J6P8C4_PEROL|nr:Protein phosphatase 1G [Perkinsus olseni]